MDDGRRDYALCNLQYAMCNVQFQGLSHQPDDQARQDRDRVSQDGQHTAESNEAFDRSLRERNSEWGVRDINEIRNVAEEHGMMLAEIEPMPGNNMILVFEWRGWFNEGRFFPDITADHAARALRPPSLRPDR